MGKKAILSPYSINFFFLYKFFWNDFGSEIEDFFNLKRFRVLFLSPSFSLYASGKRKKDDGFVGLFSRYNFSLLTFVSRV
jgi:hypothetical protein